MALFKRVTIVGLGLIGGSLGMAMRRKRLAREVVGVSRRAAAIAQAKRRGAIDRGTTSLEAGVRDADVVVLAAPVDLIVPLAKRAARAMRRGAIVTDVGSTKGAIVRALEGRLPNGVVFIGAHPLAGSEQRGLTAARPDLFDGSRCILTATRRTPRRALRMIRYLWQPLARRILVMDPSAHDRLLASVSHLPHLLAFALVDATESDGLRIAPPSFLEATRVAKSDPDLWDDILLSNRNALIEAMDRFDATWKRFRRLLVTSDRASLKRLLHRVSTIRRQVHDESAR